MTVRAWFELGNIHNDGQNIREITPTQPVSIETMELECHRYGADECVKKEQAIP